MTLNKQQGVFDLARKTWGCWRVIAVFLLLLSASGCDNNSELKYADSGFPSNCRALISAAIDDWNKSSGTPEEFAVMRGSLASIDRNCGKNGYLWQ